ncbi:FliI/YscN family ATPase [Buchnera aphidicola (Thelaxes californica)]|uniref:Flagellum-specific ATP synthase n=1 Tax=Buchnera aphidicola (Thelaxes californica) TaxID=1315998 RepID=A0A4D6YLS8_9GAMM|nr:FliI/YscN family ATPase [Buchnera aphidicola]QCI26618.1 FliI/YscN family ATPase [Buchnera aphidicola (Thelaxes californica)]
MLHRFDKWMYKIRAFSHRIKNFSKISQYGYVTSYTGSVLEIEGIFFPVGSQCMIEVQCHSQEICYVLAEIIGFKKNTMFAILLKDVSGLFFGAKVYPKCTDNNIHFLGKMLPIGYNLLGRVIDCFGNPLDGLNKIKTEVYTDINQFHIINPFKRAPIDSILDTGIRSINALLTIGKGQRIGLFAGSGVGKSVLLGMISKFTDSDVVVIGLIGERSREVKEFIDDLINSVNMNKIIVVVAPASAPSVSKIQAALYTVCIAEYFRDRGKSVLLIFDSLTRFAMAHREIALSLGEIPSSKGYPPSVLSKLLFFIERCGTGKHNETGTISAFYTILTEEEGLIDPVADTARSILDGHIVLSRSYAESGYYPAINIEKSISRTMFNLVNKEHFKKACYIKQLISSYNRNIDLINIGAYVHGTDVILDHSIKLWPKLLTFLTQNMHEKSSYHSSYQQLIKIIG